MFDKDKDFLESENIENNETKQPEIKNTIPVVDETIDNLLSEKTKNIRNQIDSNLEDVYEEEKASNSDIDDDILNSLLNYSKSSLPKEKQVVVDDEQNDEEIEEGGFFSSLFSKKKKEKPEPKEPKEKKEKKQKIKKVKKVKKGENQEEEMIDFEPYEDFVNDMRETGEALSKNEDEEPTDDTNAFDDSNDIKSEGSDEKVKDYLSFDSSGMNDEDDISDDNEDDILLDELIGGGNVKNKKEKKKKEKKQKEPKPKKEKIKKEKPVKDKKSLFGKKKKVDKEDLENSEDSEFNTDDTVKQITDNDYFEINSFEDIENIKSKQPFKFSFDKLKMNKKIIFLVFCIFLLLLSGFGLLALFMLPNEPKKDVVKKPEEIIVDVDDDDFIVEATIQKQGKIKRILGNKIIIVPDDELNDVIYYLSDSFDSSVIKSGEYIQYDYRIENYIPEILKVSKVITGEVIYKGIMTMTILNDGDSVKFTYSKDLEDIIKTIEAGNKITYVSDFIDNEMVIVNIINIEGQEVVEDIIEDSNEVPTTETPKTNSFNRDDFYNEYLTIETRYEEPRETVKTHFEDNQVSFYNGISKPVWIRFAWRVSDISPNVPSIENVGIILKSPSGIEINYDNIEKYGRMWIDGNIVNFALKKPEIGNYTLINQKPNGTNLGETKLFLMELSGFISIDKFGANLIDKNNLELIWNIGGVPDDGLEIEIYLTNDRFSTMIYSGSSKKENLHIIDKRIVDVSNIPEGKYNIIVKVKDIDLRTTDDNPEIPENTIVVAAETITDTKNMGVLILQ